MTVLSDPFFFGGGGLVLCVKSTVLFLNVNLSNHRQIHENT